MNHTLQRVLVLSDDRWHPARTPRAGLAPLTDFAFDWVEDVAGWSSERLFDYPVVVLTKANNTSAADETQWVDDGVAAAFAGYLRSGRGLLAIHSGTSGYEAQPILRHLLGGVFDRHPPQCPVTITPRSGHPLGAGSHQFTAVDEHYHMQVDDPDIDVFLTATSKHGIQPAGWTRREGAGRVCVLTPGHNLEVWLQAEFQTLIRNGLTWCFG